MKQTVLAFVDRINAHDVQGILELIADDYTFINSAGDRFHGQKFMQDTWQAQFEQHPDFQIEVERVIADDQAVAIFGKAVGTYSQHGEMYDENHWEVPAAYLGIARDGKMVHWQVFSDASIVFDVIKANE
jgi:ketosteroid isomerase-like protein